MNNEPVAWMSEFGQFIGKVQDEICHIPLYTHPADKKVEETTDLYEKVCNCKKKLNLTDEEILKMAANMFHYSEYRLVIKFARAILRKAQE